MKTNYFQLYIAVFLCWGLQQTAFSQTNYLLRSATSVGGASEKIENKGNTYIIQQVIGQSSSIGTYTVSSYILRQGFIQHDILSKVTDSNIPTSLVVTVFPNPFSSTLFLNFEKEIKSIINVSVYNMVGVQLLAKSFQSEERVQLALDQLASGEYIVKARTANMQFISKIIKD
ncbi:MAG: T9SS type A sorting domain-containing protein [Leeuwenhoekiella sp.]